MAYNITPNTQPVNIDYENDKNFNQVVQIAHDEAQLERTRRANQPSKYTQALKNVNDTLNTVQNVVKTVSAVTTGYTALTEASFKQDQLEQQMHLQEQIQSAVNEKDWDKVATISMANMRTASQMPEYMSMLGSMAKIEGNEGAAALLKSINTEQQGKIDLENLKGGYSLQKQALSNQGAMQRAMYNQSQQNARFNERLKFNQDRAAMIEEGKNIRQQNGVNSNANKSGKPTRNNFGTAPVNNTTTPSDTNATTSTSTEATTPTENNSYVNTFKNKTYTVPLAGKSQTNKISDLRQQEIDASNAPTKQEQAKAQENKKRTLENQQTTNELVNSYQNSELPSMMYNFKNAKGTDAGSKLNYILTNPDEYDVNIVTEPKDIRTIINGTDNNLANTNLADKYNNVISIAQIKELSTGKTQNLYLDANQAYQFNSIANYANEKNQKIKNAMGNETKNNSSEKINTLSTDQKFSQIRELMTNPNQGIRFANSLGIEPTNTNIKKAAEYITFINSKPNINELKDYVYSDKTLDDVVYDNFNGYRDAGEKFDQYIYETEDDYNEDNLRTRNFTDDYLRTQGSYDYFDSSVNVPLDIRKAQRSARSTMAPYSENASSRKKLAERLSVPYTSGVEIGNNTPDKNINYLTKKVVDNYVPSNYKEAVMGNESLSRNVVLLSATASELGYTNNEIKDIIKLGLSSEKPLTIPQVLKKYDPKKYKALEKIGISDIPTLVGSALFGTPARVYDKLTGQKNDY